MLCVSHSPGSGALRLKKTRQSSHSGVLLSEQTYVFDWGGLLRWRVALLAPEFWIVSVLLIQFSVGPVQDIVSECSALA